MIGTFQIQSHTDSDVYLVPYHFEKTEYTQFSEDNQKLSNDEHSVNHHILQVYIFISLLY